MHQERERKSRTLRDEDRSEGLAAREKSDFFPKLAERRKSFARRLRSPRARRGRSLHPPPHKHLLNPLRVPQTIHLTGGRPIGFFSDGSLRGGRAANRASDPAIVFSPPDDPFSRHPPSASPAVRFKNGRLHLTGPAEAGRGRLFKCPAVCRVKTSFDPQQWLGGRPGRGFRLTPEG